MLCVDGDLDTGAGLLTQAGGDRFRKITEHLDAHRAVESLLVRAPSMIGDHAHVRLERRGVRMNLDDGHLVAGVVDVLVEPNHPGFLPLHEAHELGHAAALGVERPSLQAIRRDEDQGAGHGSSIERSARTIRKMSRETLVERVADSGAVPLHIVTACHGDRRDGCLVAFATQASMKPARMLVCLSTANLTYRIAVSSPALAVHLVPADRHDLAERFGGQTGDDTDKLSDIAWTAGPGGLPLLDDCPVRLIGQVVSRHPFGDHEGFLLEPLEDADVAKQEPLLTREAMDIRPGHPV